jgi:tryptophan halogenase
MLGQGMVPEQYHPVVDNLSDDELKSFLSSIDADVQRKVAQLPEHQRFIDHYCRAG